LFGSLKAERLHGQHFETRRQGKDEALDWLLWYNRNVTPSASESFKKTKINRAV
jgi:hypothetical protein